MNQEQITSFIQSENNSHQVVIWSKSYCPYCTQTKNLFQSMPEATDVVIHEMDRHTSGTALQTALQAISGQRTVPNVFVQGQHLGGNDDTQQAHRTGKLLTQLQLSPK